jgi:hypothetical protein
MKFVQSAIQKYITWPQKFGKDKQTWDKTCIDSGLRPKKFNTPMKTI